MKTLQTAWVIPTLNRAKDIERLFESYLKQTSKPNKVIVIDASNDHQTRDLCAKYKSSISSLIYHFSEQRGSVTQRLLAFDYLQDIDYALFLDDDFELDEHAFDILCNTALKYPINTCFELNFKTMAFGSKLQETGNNKIFNFIKKIFLLPHESTKKSILPSGSNTWINEYVLNIKNEVMEIGWLSGCCMFLPIKSIITDPNKYLNIKMQKFTGYALGEDVYLSVQLSKEGYKFYRIMDAWGIHHKAPSARPDYEKLIAAKVYNYNLINKAIAKDLSVRIAFYWSLIGNFMLALATATATGSLAPIRGFIKGFNS